MELLALAEKGTPFLLLGILYFMAKIDERLKSLREDVTLMKDGEDGVVWHENCRLKHREVDRRLGKVERATGLNGAGE